MKFTLALAMSSLAASVSAHGYFTKPEARQPGKAFQNSCGMQAYYNMAGDINGNVQGLMQVVSSQSDYNPETCRLWKCKGMKYADNTANVQHYKPGQTVPMNFHIQAPHTGYANVSIIDITKPDGAVLAQLKNWDTYASTATNIPAGEQSFSVKMPSNLGKKCAVGGKCAIQMFWNAPSIDQTYESCVDFTLSAGSSKRHVRDFTLENEDEIEV